eukprot:6454010-Amphidinium_carterae.2
MPILMRLHHIVSLPSIPKVSSSDCRKVLLQSFELACLGARQALDEKRPPLKELLQRIPPGFSPHVFMRWCHQKR